MPALPSTTLETPPANPPVTSEGVSWGCLLSGSSGNAGPVSYVMARQGAYSSPDPPRRKERPKVSATGAHDSSSCVLKCSLDKSRPVSPARLRLRLHAGLRARGRRGPKNLRHTTGKIEPARTHKPRQNLQAEPVSVLRLLSVLESSKPCPHCRQRPGDTPSQSPVTSEGVSWGCLLSGSSGNAGPVSYVMARQGAYLPLTLPGGRKGRRYPQLEHTILVPVFSSVP